MVDLFLLTDDERQAALGIARSAIACRVTGGAAPVAAALGAGRPHGVFVSVSIGGQLRGCLGTIEGDEGLGEDIARCAADAASEDPRFRPVSCAELERLSIEISVLGPLEPIDPSSPHAILIGTHGLVVQSGRRRGLLLPQVATEWGWTTAEFLRQTCVKAGLDGDAWRRGAEVFRFTADVFGDRHL